MFIAVRKWATWIGGILLAIFALSEDPIRDAMGDVAKSARERIQESVGEGFEGVRDNLGELEWTG